MPQISHGTRREGVVDICTRTGIRGARLTCTTSNRREVGRPQKSAHVYLRGRKRPVASGRPAVAPVEAIRVLHSIDCRKCPAVRALPVPINQPEIVVLAQVAKDTLQEVQQAAMPRQKRPGVVDVRRAGTGRRAAVDTMLSNLFVPTYYVVGRQRPDLAKGVLELGELRPRFHFEGGVARPDFWLIRNELLGIAGLRKSALILSRSVARVHPESHRGGARNSSLSKAN